MDYSVLEDHSNDCPSAIFENDNKYYELLDSIITNLNDCVLHGSDMEIPNPYQTRLLLDWMCETRRRFHINKKKNNKL